MASRRALPSLNPPRAATAATAPRATRVNGVELVVTRVFTDTGAAEESLTNLASMAAGTRAPTASSVGAGTRGLVCAAETVVRTRGRSGRTDEVRTAMARGGSTL